MTAGRAGEGSLPPDFEEEASAARRSVLRLGVEAPVACRAFLFVCRRGLRKRCLSVVWAEVWTHCVTLCLINSLGVVNTQGGLVKKKMKKNGEGGEGDDPSSLLAFIHSFTETP